MIKLLIFICIFFFNFNIFATEVEVIELHNKTFDQLIFENDEVFLDDKQKDKKKLDEVINDEKKNSVVSEEIIYDVESDEDLNNNNDNDNDNDNNADNSNNLVLELPSIWEQTTKEDLIFLLKNLNTIDSKVLKNEIISNLNLNNLLPNDINENEFKKIIIDTLLKLDERKKTYQIVQSFSIDDSDTNFSFYQEFILNYLLSTYNLNEACVYRNEIKEYNLKSNSNFFLKIDIFCLVLEERFDEANLLNSLLIESGEADNYFQYLFIKLQNNQFEEKIDISVNNINEKNIFLYSAMQRIGNLPLSNQFLEMDPINLSIPIILSSETNIELRLKAAHFAFTNKLINIDSLAALYQTVDFTYKELNKPKEFLNTMKDNIEMGMAFYYQLINIQLLPITRLEAIIQFWEYAKKSNLELIAYKLSLKNLNSVEPTLELSKYGPDIAKSYIFDEDFERAEKWLLFSENSLNDNYSVSKINESRFLFNIYNYDENYDLIKILYNDLKEINSNSNKIDNQQHQIINEFLYIIFDSLGFENKNIFLVDKKITEDRLMPSFYLLNMIRDSAVDKNQIQLLLSIIVSINGKKWNQLHPEHLKLILNKLRFYKNGILINDIILEILKDNKII